MNNPYAWYLKNLKLLPQNGLKVMTTFSCGGGSSMGYKLAGCDVIAANDIDPEMAYVSILNFRIASHNSGWSLGIVTSSLAFRNKSYKP